MKLRYSQRPKNFRINPNHQLAKGLVFAGLGLNPGTPRYYDSSVGQKANHGTSAQADQATKWSMRNGRQALYFDGTDDLLNLSRVMTIGTTWTQSYLFDAESGPTYCSFLSAAAGRTSVSLRHGTGIYVLDDSYGYWGRWFGVTTLTGLHSLVITTTGNVVEAFWDGTSLGAPYDGPPAGSFSWSLINKFGIVDAGYQAKGYLLDCLIHSRILSKPEITALSRIDNYMLALNGDDPGLLIEEAGPVGAKTYFTWQGWEEEPATGTRLWPWQQRRSRRMTGAR